MPAFTAPIQEAAAARPVFVQMGASGLFYQFMCVFFYRALVSSRNPEVTERCAVQDVSGHGGWALLSPYTAEEEGYCDYWQPRAYWMDVKRYAPWQWPRMDPNDLYRPLVRQKAVDNVSMLMLWQG